jgi:integrase
MAIGEIRIKVKRRDDGTTYEVAEGEYRDPRRPVGKQRCFVSVKVASFSTPKKAQKEARRLLTMAEAEVKAGTHAKGSETVEQCIEEYCDALDQKVRRGNGKPSEDYAITERAVLKKVPENIRRRKISSFKHSALIEKEIMALFDQGYKQSTVKRVKDTLSRVFTFAMKPKPGRDEGYIARNVIRDYKFLTGRIPRREREGTDEEAAKLLDAAREYKSKHPKGQLLAALNVSALETLIFLCGLRPSEACPLHQKDINRLDPPYGAFRLDDVAAVICVQRRITRNGGVRPGLKEGKPRKYIQVPLKVVEAIDEVERYWQAHRWATGPGHDSYTKERISWRTKRFFENSDAPLERRQDGYLFLGKEGTLYHAHSLAKFVNKLALQAAIFKKDAEGNILLGKNGQKQADVSNYSFRHKVATDNSTLLPVAVAAAETGHHPQTFLTNYVHERPEHQVLTATAMGERSRRLRAAEEKLAAEKLAAKENAGEPPSATNSRPRLLTRGK